MRNEPKTAKAIPLSGTPELDRFTATMRQILSVPKAQLDKIIHKPVKAVKPKRGKK